MSASKYKRPGTAKPSKPIKKTKKKKERLSAQEQYMEQLRQQQLLQQLAMEQQNKYRQQMEQEQEESQIEITPEQAATLLQQLIEKQQNGEQLSQEEVEQFNFLQQVLQNNFVNQQELQEEQHYARPVRKTTKKKKSKKKVKKNKSTKQRINEKALLMMMQNQQNPQQFAQDQEKYDFDEIKEVDEEETPIRGLSGEGAQIYEGNDEGEIYHAQQDPAHAGVHDTDIPNQINAQVPANFRVQPQPEEYEEEENQYVQKQPKFYPPYQLNPVEQENIPSFQGVTPEQLFYLKEMNKNQMIASKLENYSDLYNPLSQAVNRAKTKLKGMRNYDLDVVDKKLHDDILSKRQGIQSFGDVYREESAQMFKNYFQKIAKKKKAKKEKRIEKVKCDRFSQEIYNKTKSRMLKRDAKQVLINRRLQELASKLEKDKIIEEKKMIKDFNSKLAKDKQIMLESFQQFWSDQIKMTKEKVSEEKEKRRLTELTEIEALSEWKKEINSKQKQKLEKLLNILEQQDQRYEVENLDLEKMEENLIKLYKRV